MKTKFVTAREVIKTYGFFELFSLVRSKFKNGFRKEELTPFTTNSLIVYDSISALDSNLSDIDISFYISELSDRYG